MKNFSTEQETATDKSDKPPISTPSDVNPVAENSPSASRGASAAGAKQSGGTPKRQAFYTG